MQHQQQQQQHFHFRFYDIKKVTKSFSCFFLLSRMLFSSFTLILENYFEVQETILFFYKKPELSVGFDPGMALTPLLSFGQGPNTRPSDREPSALPLDHYFRFSPGGNHIINQY